MRSEPLINPTQWYVKECGDDIHVVPDYGPEHTLDKNCWCNPDGEVYERIVYMHNVAQ
jgi:hypothetical protein